MISAAVKNVPGQRLRRRWPALDGLRALAVLVVIGDHANVLPGGYLGVDVFFVLSGFLITALLIDEWDSHDRIVLRDFYMRRVLRILPALGTLIVGVIVVGSLLWGYGDGIGRLYARVTFEAVPAVILFVGNWVRALDPSAMLGSLGSLGALGHTWSLAVEEQFYLLWPVTFAIVMRRNVSRERLAALLSLVAVAQMTIRCVLEAVDVWGAGIQYRIYFGTDLHSDGLLIGCALAFWLSSATAARRHVLAGKLSRRAAWPASALLLLLFVGGNFTRAPFEISIVVLATGVLVAGVVQGEVPIALERVLTSDFAIRIGRRSYALYLWHYVLITTAQILCAPYTGLPPIPAGLPRLAFSAALSAAVIASFLAAELSYHFIELPALRLKRRFRAGPVPA